MSVAETAALKDQLKRGSLSDPDVRLILRMNAEDSGDQDLLLLLQQEEEQEQISTEQRAEQLLPWLNAVEQKVDESIRYQQSRWACGMAWLFRCADRFASRFF